jgi:Sec-independent protein secretion pathway component TatC
MAVALGHIDHTDHLSLVGHLDELRMRLIVSLVAVTVAFAFCMWQNHELLHIINKPLERQTEKQVRAGSGPSRRHLRGPAERTGGRSPAPARSQHA